MKKWYMALGTGVLALLFSAGVQAAENLADWKDYVWQGNVTMSHPGNVLSVSANGTNNVSMGRVYKNFSNAVGMYATVTVSQSSGESGVGIRRNIGKAADGNKVMAELYVNEYAGDKRIQYNIRKRDNDGNTLKVYARGYLGNFFDGWNIGQNVLIAFARVGDEVWFYTPQNNVGLVKILLMEPVEPVEILEDKDKNMEIWAWTQNGSGNSVSSTVSDVEILYPWW
ncbi:MAG: hypothetical protein AB7S75_04185 [Desulfococcaceae bacterium]